MTLIQLLRFWCSGWWLLARRIHIRPQNLKPGAVLLLVNVSLGKTLGESRLGSGRGRVCCPAAIPETSTSPPRPTPAACRPPHDEHNYADPEQRYEQKKKSEAGPEAMATKIARVLGHCGQSCEYHEVSFARL
jgi:hypothetical protein